MKRSRLKKDAGLYRVRYGIPDYVRYFSDKKSAEKFAKDTRNKIKVVKTKR